MKARETVIAWTPVYWATGATQGKVEVGPLIAGTNDWTVGYACTGGAAYVERRNWRGPKSVAALFIDFHTIVVRDGIDPEVAHRALLAIDEYAEAIASVPGPPVAQTARGGNTQHQSPRLVSLGPWRKPPVAK
jgi:hypothetical protein